MLFKVLIINLILVMARFFLGNIIFSLVYFIARLLDKDLSIFLGFFIEA